MKQTLITGFMALAVLFLSSCLEQETTVTLNKDGSGTIVEETVFSKDVVDMMEMQGGGNNPIDQAMNKDKAKAKAAQYGEGVEFVSLEPVKCDGGKGAKVTYKFDDINKITLNPQSALADMGPPSNQKKIKEGDDVKIDYADGKLTLTMPEPDPANTEKAEKAKDTEMPPEALQMFRGMKISNKLVIAPGIKKTNASHREGNTITLMEMDFDKLMQNPDGMNALKKIDLKDRAAAQKQLEGLKGVKVETKKEVTVTVK